MPRSEFDSELRVSGPAVRVSGPVEPERDQQGAVVPRRNPVDFHFVIEQDGTVAHGRAREAPPGTWTADATAPRDWRAGTALAFGVAVLVQEEPGTGLETFTWSQQVRLTP
jgi:hypothetical protein